MPAARSLCSLSFILWIAGAGLPATALAQAPPPPSASATPAPVIRDDVRKLHNDALLALKGGQIEAAYKGFLEAWTLQNIPRIAGNLGRAELKLGKHRDAAEHLALFLRESTGLSNEEQIDLLDQFAQAKARIGVLHVDVAQAGAEVWVDGTAVGTAPPIHEIYLDPGRHTIEARHAGAVARKEIAARPGMEETVRLDVASPPPTSDPVPTAAPSVGGTTESRSIVPALVLGGVGVATVIAGAVSLGMYSAKRDEALSMADRVLTEGGSCNEVGSTKHPLCETVRNTALEADTFRVAGPILLGGGAVLGALAGAYLLWWPAPGSAKGDSGVAAGTRVNVAATPAGGAVSISGRF